MAKHDAKEKVELKLVALSLNNPEEMFKKLIKSLELTEFDDFCRIWSLIQNHGWLLTNGQWMWLSFRAAGRLIAKIDNNPDTDYMSYYCCYLLDDCYIWKIQNGGIDWVGFFWTSIYW